MTRTRGILAAVFLLAGIGAWLALAPTGLEPQAWQPSADPGLSGPFADNDALAGVERLFPEEIAGADTLIAGGDGRLLTGLADGRIVALDPASGASEVLALVQGRPLGLAQTGPRSFVVANPPTGLTAASAVQSFSIAAAADNRPLRYVADVALSAAGIVYFVDGSSRHGLGQAYAALLEHRADGRLLRYDELARSLTVLAEGLHFPTGLALGPGEEYLLVAETASYRILRHWLKGPHAGRTETFVEGLPGFPAHLSWNGRDRFWVALYAPRIGWFDRTAAAPGWRQVIARLPAALQPRPAPRAWVLGLDRDGAVVANLQHGGSGAFAPVSSVLEHDGWLYLGSQTSRGIARVRRPD